MAQITETGEEWEVAPPPPITIPAPSEMPEEAPVREPASPAPERKPDEVPA